MKESRDDNDVLPSAVLYFYPRDEELKKQKLVECGEIVGIVQYFQHDMFQSIANKFYYQENLVVHEHYGRHSSFLSLPNHQYTSEQASINLKHIMDLFNTLYGTWNHITSVYEKDNRMGQFLNNALTPIVEYVMNETYSLLDLFSIIEYRKLKDSNQRVLLESKHCLNYLKQKYGVQDGLIGLDKKVLYSTWDSDTTFYLQVFFLLKKQLSKDLIYVPWESKILKNGVSLFRIHTRTSMKIPTDQIRSPVATSNSTSLNSVTYRTMATPMNISKNTLTNSFSLRSSSIANDIGSFDSMASFNHQKRFGMSLLTDTYFSSEGTDVDTDTVDEISSLSAAETRSSSSGSAFGTMKKNKNEEDCKVDVKCFPSLNPLENSLTDEDKIKRLNSYSRSRSRSSTMSNGFEETIQLDSANNYTEVVDQIEFVLIDQNGQVDNETNDSETSDVIDEIESESSRDRTITVVGQVDLDIPDIPDFRTNECHEIQVSWTDIPDRNNEYERDELVLYVQKNSRMMFAGVFQQNLLTKEYLDTLWNLMLSQLAGMEAEIPAATTSKENLRATADVKFYVSEHNRSAEFLPDGNREYKKIPSEESTKLALFARAELKRNPECKIVGLSRGNHLVSIDRSFPTRMTYSCRKIQENL